jgi:hypothetical protein
MAFVCSLVLAAVFIAVIEMCIILCRKTTHILKCLIAFRCLKSLCLMV